MSPPGVKDDTVMTDWNVVCTEMNGISHSLFSTAQASICRRIRMLREVPGLLGKKSCTQ